MMKPVAPAWLLILPALWLAGCQSHISGPSATGAVGPHQGQDREQDRAPDHVPMNLALLPDPEPRREPLARYGNHSPYQVWGRTYEVMPDAAGHKETGVASWYGAKFHGRPTSSGEPYDMYQLTAAHRSLPLPSYVRVTNLDNQRSVIVRVNDRGPFHDQRIIDLSYAAAVRLDFVRQGTARVHVEVIAPPAAPGTVRAPIPAPAPVTPAQPGAAPVVDGPFYLQAGAFSELQRAEQLQLSLLPLVAGAAPAVEIRQQPGDRLFRVWIGPIDHMAEAARIQDLLVAENHPRPHLIREH